MLATSVATMTADTRLLYLYDARTKVGTLSYDDDGSSDHAAIVIARLVGVTSLSAVVDFAVV